MSRVISKRFSLVMFFSEYTIARSSRSLMRMRLSPKKNANFIESCAEGESPLARYVLLTLCICVLSLIESLKRPCPRVLMRLNRVYVSGSHDRVHTRRSTV